MFDVTVCSSFWPKGLLLCKKLSEQGKKVCYINFQQENDLPIGVFLKEDDQAEKVFLESVAHLYQQDGGFCLLSPKGYWSFQGMDFDQMSLSSLFQNLKTNTFSNFTNHWLTALSRNLMSRHFQVNSQFGSDMRLDLFLDYFLLEFTSKQKKQFKEEHSKITYIEASLEDLRWDIEKSYATCFVNDQKVQSHRFIWLAREEGLSNFCVSLNKNLPEWEWQSVSLEGNIGNYKNIVPSHFVSLKNLSLPWTYDNLLSVFFRHPYLEVWFRNKYATDDKEMLDLIVAHLQPIFKNGVTFQIRNSKKRKSFTIYGDSQHLYKLDMPKNICLPPIHSGDLLNHLKYETHLLKRGFLQ